MSSNFVEPRVVPIGMTDPASEPYYALLRQAFNLVADPNDCRGPINVVVPASLEQIVYEAIRFMTATETRVMGRFVDHATKTPLVRLVSIGYRAGPAGDH